MKKRLFLIFKIIIALLAYAYIIWKIYQYRNIISSFVYSYYSDTQFIILFFVVFVLMFVNWLTEAIKWRYLLKNIVSISILHSIKAVMAGLSTGIFTPNRIGEFAGRPFFTDKSKITSGVFAAMAGSFAQSLITLFMGIVAINLYFFTEKSNFFTDKIYIQALLVFSLLLMVFLSLLFFNLQVLTPLLVRFSFLKKYKKDLDFLVKYKKNELLIILLYSFVRYFLFFVQFYILLLMFKVNIALYQAFISIALTYLFLFVVPVFAFSELGIRASLAVFFIGMYSINYPGILAASIFLWIINLALPAIGGSLLILTKKET